MLYDDYINYTKIYKDKYGQRTLVLMEVGSFWELYNCDEDKGANMQHVCGLLNITLSRKNKNIPVVSATNPMMAGFPSHAINKFLPILIDNDFTVVLIGQTTPPPNPKRDVVGIYSKGTFTETAMISDCNNFIMCLVLDTQPSIYNKNKLNTCVGIAYADITTGDVKVHELYSESIGENLYKHYIKTKPSELLIYRTSDACDFDVLNKILAVAPTSSVKNYASIACDDQISCLNYQAFIFNKIYQNQNLLSIHESLDIDRDIYSASALSALLRYIIDHDPALTRNLRKPLLFREIEKTQMDLYYNCMEQLNMSDLLKILNESITACGKRYFKYRLTNPYCDSLLISKSFENVSKFFDNPDDLKYIRKNLLEVCDIERMFRRIVYHKIHPHELACLYETLNKISEICRHASFNNETIFQICHDMCCIIDEIIDLQVASQQSVETLSYKLFKKGTCEKLDEIVREKCNTHDYFSNLVDTWNSLVSCNGCFKIEQTERDGLYIICTSKRYETFKTQLSKSDEFVEFYKVGSTNTHVKLSSKKLDLANNKLGKLEREIEIVTKELYTKILNDLSVFFTGIDQLISYTSKLDFYSTCAYIALKNNYCKPNIIDHATSTLIATKMRHPLVELLDKSDVYIPNNVDFKSNKQWLLYGLNAAGKSTLMKMVALNVIMAQAGMYVPCESFDFKPFHAIYTRITKGDDILTGQSTFMMEMSELRNILNKANENSLVIGDELCSGTETLSAIAIVQTGIKHLKNRNSTFVFATHLHELVDKVSDVRICHLHVTYDPVNMKLAYDRILKDGDGPKTYGIEVCKALGLDDTFISDAMFTRQILENGVVNSSPKISTYNATLLYDEICEICKCKCVKESEVHHIKHQASFQLPNSSMNAKHNLIVLCRKCHDDVHNGSVTVPFKLLQYNHDTPISISKTPDATVNADILSLEQYIETLRFQAKLSINKISDKIYQEKGIKLNAYKIRKILKMYH